MGASSRTHSSIAKEQQWEGGGTVKDKGLGTEVPLFCPLWQN